MRTSKDNHIRTNQNLLLIENGHTVFVQPASSVDWIPDSLHATVNRT